MGDEEAKKVIILHNFDRTEYIQLRCPKLRQTMTSEMLMAL